MEHRRFSKYADSSAGRKLKMREENKQLLQETEAAFVAAILLLNFLILAVVSAAFWFVYSLLTQFSQLNAVLRGDILS